MAGKKGKQRDSGQGLEPTVKKKKKISSQTKKEMKFYSNKPEETFFQKTQLCKKVHVVFETRVVHQVIYHL